MQVYNVSVSEVDVTLSASMAALMGDSAGGNKPDGSFNERDKNKTLKCCRAYKPSNERTWSKVQMKQI